MKILIMGLPGSGKTTLATELAYHFVLPHHNADTVREYYDDWDFSQTGRLRQAQRMKKCWGIVDFICPTWETRQIVEADYIIWMDTIEESRFEDTNKLFTAPEKYDVRIESFEQSNIIIDRLKNGNFKPGIKDCQRFLGVIKND